MTLNDFLKECEMFPYSQENFDLVKEAAEINIAAMYLESQEYMAENTGAFEGLGSSYMMEAAGGESVKLLAQKAGGKKEKWAGRVKDLWQRIVAALKKFWNMVVEKWKKIRAKGADIKKNLARIKVTDEVAKEIGELVDQAVKTSGIPISDKQREGFKKLPRNVIVISENGLKNRLASVVCNSTIDLAINNNGRFGLAMSEDQLKGLFKRLSDKKVLAAKGDSLDKLNEYIKECQSKNLTSGISVSKDQEEMNELIRYITDAEAKLAKDIQDYKPGENESEGVGNVNQLFSNVNAVTKSSIMLYSCVLKYQEIVMNGLDAIINKAPKGATAKEEKEEKEE